MRAENYESWDCWPLIDDAKSKSMLHWETLTLLYHYASQAEGAVLEIGPYIGGATIVMGKARQPRDVICVQPKVSNPTHPDLPTDDVLLDLRRNIMQYGLADSVHVVEGYSWEVLEHVETLLQGRGVDLLVIDADGMISRDISYYGPLLSDNCILVLDDYGGFHPPRHAKNKQELVREWVHLAEAAGIVERISVVPWGTWFGKVVRK